MKQIVLNNGFAVEVDENVIDNMELVDALAEMKDDDDPLGISKVTKLLLGKKQRKALYDSVRTEDGRVPLNEISHAIEEIFAAFDDQGKTDNPRRYDGDRQKCVAVRFRGNVWRPGYEGTAGPDSGSACGRTEG